MMRNLSIRLLLLLAMMLPTFLGAQEFTGQATQRVYPSVVKTLEAWEVFKIDAAAVSAYAQDNLNNPIINLHLGKHEWNLMLTPNYKLVENYLLQVQTDAGIEKSFPTQIRAFRGYDLNAGGRSCLTLDGDFLYGYVEVGAERFYIEPLWYYNENAPRDEFIVYKKSDVIYDSNVTCASIEGDELLEEYIGNEDIKQGDAAESLACYEIDIAIASDLSMFNKYGSVGAVEIHNIAVLNNVTTDYTGNFTNDFEFNIVTQFVVTGSNPWSNSNDAGTLLGSFRNWGNAGNFGVNFDVGELWTNRDFNGGTIGIAYLNGVCNSNKYHCLQDFSNNAELLRCLTSHEIGHNFSATHDTSPGDCPPNYIMCPFVSTSNTWSSQSVSQISSYSQSKINSGCLTVCSSGGPPLEASFTVNPNPACVNEQVFFGDQSSGIISNYSWVFPGGSPATSTQPNPVVTWAVAGSYDVTLTISDAAGQSATATQTVVIKPLPVANFSYTVTGLTLSFTNLSTDAFSYIWDFGDGNASFDANPIHAYDEAGMYVVTLTAENDCGISTKTFLINTAPTAFFSASPTEGCAALTVSFQNESSSNATSFQWSFTGGFPAASNLENPVVVYPTSGVYNVSLTAFNNSGSATYIANGFITVTNVPSSGFTFDVNGLIVEFTNTSTNGDSFLWNFGDGNTSTEEDPVHVYDIGGSYTVTLTTTNDCGTTTSTHVVNMVPPPVADFTAGPTSGCASLVVQYTNSSVDADTYMWSFPGGSPATSTDENPEVTYDDAGTYSATLIATNVGGSDTLTFQSYITVEDTPDASFDYAANMDTVSFTNNTSNGNSYSWDFGDGGTSTEADPTHIYSEDGNYNVVLIATNDCGDDTTMLTVFVVTPPIAGFSADAIEGCLPFTVNFTNESSENATDFSWEFEGGDPATSTDENPSSTWNAAGTYTVTLTASNGAGSSTSTITITVNDVPTSDFTSDVNGADVDFTNNSTNADSYSWDFGDGNSSTEADPSHTYTEDGVYTVVLTSTNECGSTTSTMTVTIVTPPIAGFSADAIEGCLPLTVNFTNESS
ncbi:MAG: PKD domain-containing protein [Saprospiraceae bacterium]